MGVVAGVRLGDGRAVVLKAHHTAQSPAFLAVVHAVDRAAGVQQERARLAGREGEPAHAAGLLGGAVVHDAGVPFAPAEPGLGQQMSKLLADERARSLAQPAGQRRRALQDLVSRYFHAQAVCSDSITTLRFV